MNYPYVLKYIEDLCEENTHYLVTEFIDGQTLKAYLNYHEFISVANGCKIMVQLLVGLKLLHDN
jgi:serine/threonine protein kinase